MANQKEVRGHQNIATTNRYTRLQRVYEIPAHERLADAVPIADIEGARGDAKGAALATFGRVCGSFAGVYNIRLHQTAPRNIPRGNPR